MKAKKKPIEKYSPSDLGVDLTPLLETIKVAEPPKRVGGGKVRQTVFVFCRCEFIIFFEGGERGRAGCEAQRAWVYRCEGIAALIPSTFNVIALPRPFLYCLTPKLAYRPELNPLEALSLEAP